MDFSESYMGRLRQQVGHTLIKVPGARIVLEDAAGRVLLQQRSDFGIWGLPAGCPEEGETVTETILREVWEETGLTVLDYTCFGYSSNPAYELITYPNGDRIHCYSLMFTSTCWEGDLVDANEETLALAFYPLDALPEMMPNHRRTLELFRAWRATGEFQVD